MLWDGSDKGIDRILYLHRREEGGGGLSETLRYKIQMSSTATTWKREEIYNDMDSGRLLAIEYSDVETS